jgi:hypothetical protein
MIYLLRTGLQSLFTVIRKTKLMKIRWVGLVGHLRVIRIGKNIFFGKVWWQRTFLRPELAHWVMTALSQCRTTLFLLSEHEVGVTSVDIHGR